MPTELPQKGGYARKVGLEKPSEQWPDIEGFDWTGKSTVPENPSKASAYIVIAGTLSAYFLMASIALAPEIATQAAKAKDTLVEISQKTKTYLGSLVP